jgi:hypothetical protein
LRGIAAIKGGLLFDDFADEGVVQGPSEGAEQMGATPLDYIDDDLDRLGRKLGSTCRQGRKVGVRP